jgi:hypothetical protein
MLGAFHEDSVVKMPKGSFSEYSLMPEASGSALLRDKLKQNNSPAKKISESQAYKEPKSKLNTGLKRMSTIVKRPFNPLVMPKKRNSLAIGQ